MSWNGLFFFFGLVATSFANGGIDRCGPGGEGPKPFSDITKLLDFKIRAVETPGTLQEFLVSEKKGEIIYRDMSGEIRGINLNPQFGKPKEFPISKFAQPLSRVWDSQERYLASMGDRVWLFDTNASNWAPAAERKGLAPIFWANRLGKDYLVSHTTHVNAQGDEVYEFFASRYGEFQKEPICTFSQSKPYAMRPARGVSAPNFYFYSVAENDRGRTLGIHALNTLTCRFDKGLIYEGIRHPVREVTWFEELKAVAARLDHPDQNLLWWSLNGCNYYDVGQSEIMVPNYKAPVLVTWSPQKSIDLLYPDTSEVVKTLQGIPLEELKESDLWLTTDQKKLFLRTVLQNDSNRWLLEVDLKK